MSLADVLTKSAAVLRTLSPATLTTVYDAPPEAAPGAAMLPAALQRPQSGEVAYTASQRVVWHRWEVVALVARTEDQPADYAAAMSLLEPVIAAYEANTSLGTATYYDVRPTGYQIGPAAYGDAQYLAVILTMQGKEKRGVTLS